MSGAARETLVRLLGHYQPSGLTLTRVEDLPADSPRLRARRLSLRRDDGAIIRAFLTGPATIWDHLPAVLYCHAHGGRYDIGADELLAGRPALQAPAYAGVLAEMGIVALCIDLPCFGMRAGETESALAKRHLWHGKTLFGEMLADLSGALRLLARWPGIDPARIGTFGISMGATLAFWLAALEPQVKCLAHLCCLADIATLVDTGDHDRHGHYMTVPGLIPLMSTGDVAGLAAPRPQLACMGLLDPLTPPAAVEAALADARRAYGRCNADASFTALIDPACGHAETPDMRRAVLDFFHREL